MIPDKLKTPINAVAEDKFNKKIDVLLPKHRYPLEKSLNKNRYDKFVSFSLFATLKFNKKIKIIL